MESDFSRRYFGDSNIYLNIKNSAGIHGVTITDFPPRRTDSYRLIVQMPGRVSVNLYISNYLYKSVIHTRFRRKYQLTKNPGRRGPGLFAKQANKQCSTGLCCCYGKKLNSKTENPDSGFFWNLEFFISVS